MNSGSPIRLAVFASGGGTTLQNLIDRIGDGRLHATIAVVVTSRPDAGALTRAQIANIPTAVVAFQGKSVADASFECFETCRLHGVDLVILGGFLKLIHIPNDFAGRVINIHPGLIPGYCGKGFHGHTVHQAVLDRGAKLSGCTVHFADNEYDHGPIILQRAVPVLDDDDADTLAARVFEAECEALPEAIRLFAEGRLLVERGRVKIV
jgi:phosphoribosylglycinamide formyltransferase 1